MKKLSTYFSKGELALWSSSSMLILISFLIFDRGNMMTLAASLIGTTSLIFNAKGKPIGQALMIVFSLLYGLISYTFSYFGEMITYGQSGSRFIVGNEKDLQKMEALARVKLPMRFSITIVQPGLSHSKITEEQKMLLAVTEQYLLDVANIPLRVIGNM